MTAGAGHICNDPSVDRFPQARGAQPYGFCHDLAGLELFSFDYLTTLAASYAPYPADYFVSMGAPDPGASFYSVKHGMCRPEEALGHLDTGGFRVLLKRPELHDSRYHDLFEEIASEVTQRGEPARGRILRQEATILINSPGTITPFHFDPEAAYFSQITGEKTYHVYSPKVVSEAELERFYVGGVISIAQLGIGHRDPACEHVFRLAPGKGLFQPQNAPHWVETGPGPAVSYTVVFETEAQRTLGLVRAYNCYLRRLGLEPAFPGAHPSIDVCKAGAMRMVLPLRQHARSMLAKTRRMSARG
jgi:hypothetical protein